MTTQVAEIKGFDGLYTINTFGKVYSLRKKKYLKPIINNAGYVYAYLTPSEGKGKWYGVHRLVLLSFGFKPGEEVNHRDGNKLNNYIGNLEFVTHAENIRHSFKLGRKSGGRKPGFSHSKSTRKKMSQAKNKPIIVYKDGKKKKYDSIEHVSKSLGIYRKAVYRSLVSGKPYKDYVFQYDGQSR